MANKKHVLVVPAAPRYLNPASGSNEVWYGRAERAYEIAVRLARRGHCVVIVFVGDGQAGEQHGQDNEAFQEFVYRRLNSLAVCVSSRIHCFAVSNGGEQNANVRNTRGDMLAAAQLLVSDARFQDMQSLSVVTCWYHWRAFVLLWRFFLRECQGQSQAFVPVRPRVVRWRDWRRPPAGLVRGLWWEFRGLIDALCSLDVQKTRGSANQNGTKSVSS